MLGDKAKANDAPEVVTQENITGVWMLESLEEVSCDKITETDTFPTFGDFLQVRSVDRDGSTSEITYLAWYADLDKQLLEMDCDVATVFRINGCYRNNDGEYVVSIEHVADSIEDMSG